MPVTFSDRSAKRIEFGRRGDASNIRDELPDEALLDSDDGREKTVQLNTSALDDETLRRVEGKAAVSRDDARGDMHGQTPLSDAERNRLDFTRTTVPEARAAKASLLAEGVSDWTAHFDPSLTTSEMADIARDSQVSGGARMDSADTQRARDRQGADMFREVQGQACKRARDGCESGFEEACDELVDRCDVTREEAERLIRQQQAAQSGAGATADGGVREETILRAAAHGQFIGGAEPAPRSPGYRSDKGRYVGYEIGEHDPVSRSPETGRIRSMAPAEPVPRPEQVERFGEPDSGDTAPSERDMTDMSAPGQGFLSDSQAAAGLDDGEVRETVFTAQAQSADVSLAPDEVFHDTGRVGTTALGGNVLGEGERRATAFDDEDDSLIAQDLERTRREAAAESAGVLDGGGVGVFADDRDQQASFDVGLDAGATRDREGQIAGSAGFEDRREELGTGTTPDSGEQAGLFEQETNVGGDGQMDLFGDTATETTGGEWPSGGSSHHEEESNHDRY